MKATPPVKASPPVVKDTPHVKATPPVKASPPVVKDIPLVKDSPPVKASPPVVKDIPHVKDIPLVKDSPPVVKDIPLVKDSPPVMKDIPPVMKDVSLMKEVPHVKEKPKKPVLNIQSTTNSKSFVNHWFTSATMLLATLACGIPSITGKIKVGSVLSGTSKFPLIVLPAVQTASQMRTFLDQVSTHRVFCSAVDADVPLIVSVNSDSFSKGVTDAAFSVLVQFLVFHGAILCGLWTVNSQLTHFGGIYQLIQRCFVPDFHLHMSGSWHLSPQVIISFVTWAIKLKNVFKILHLGETRLSYYIKQLMEIPTIHLITSRSDRYDGNRYVQVSEVPAGTIDPEYRQVTTVTKPMEYSVISSGSFTSSGSRKFTLADFLRKPVKQF